MAFKKGEASNPAGSLPIGEARKMVRKLTRIEFEKIENKYLWMNAEQIEKSMKEGKSQIPALELAIMSIIYHSIKDGDQKRLDWLLDRLIGGVVKRIAVMPEDISEEEMGGVPIQMSNQERIDMLEKYAETLRKEKEVIDVSPNARKDKP